MSSKRPIVKGPVGVDGFMERAEVLQDDTDMELPPGATLIGTDAGDHLERVRSPALEAGLPQNVLTAEMEFTGNDFVRANSDVSWLTLPSARVQYPRLQRYGRVEFQYTGHYFNSTIAVVGGQWLDFELMVDGVASGTVFSWNLPQFTVAGSPSFILFESTLRFIGDPYGPTTYDLEATLRINRGDIPGAYAQIINSTQAARPTIDGTASRLLNFRFRRRVVENNEATLWRSFLAWQPLYRSGL